MSSFSEHSQSLIIPLGDPAGIGMEVTLKALASHELSNGINPILVGCKKHLMMEYEQLKEQGFPNLVNPQDLEIENIPIEKNSFKKGTPNKRTGEASFLWLKRAVELTLARKTKGIVTAPIAKFAWHASGHNYPGQTELLAELAGVENPSMLFTAVSPINGWRLNTLLATTHISLSDVPKALNSELIKLKLNRLKAFCNKFTDHPTIAIAGLNPHSGEKGKLGAEEEQWLIPTLREWESKNPDTKLKGPLPPDTCWLTAAAFWNGMSSIKPPDGILALYHDQGLIPIKIIAFDQAVNTTLGLPFLRTSPDHGTACDIAGKGLAKPESMIAAIKTLLDLNQNQIN